MTAPAVDWTDLLAIPWRECGDNPGEGLDCYGLARIACARLGKRLPPWDEMIQEGADSVAQRVLRLELAEPGDVIVSRPSSAQRRHITTVVGPGLGLTTSQRGPCLVRLGLLRGVQSIWRLRQAELPGRQAAVSAVSGAASQVSADWPAPAERGAIA